MELLERRPEGFALNDFHKGSRNRREKHLGRLRARLGLSLIYDRDRQLYLWSPVDVKTIRRLEAALLRTLEEEDEER